MSPANGNFIEDLMAGSAQQPETPFLIVPGGPTVSHGEFWNRVSQMATVLTNRGAGPGTRVVSQVDKSIDAVVLYAACLHAGAVHVPLNPSFTDDELDYFVADADPAIVVVPRDRADRVAGDHAVEVLSLDADGDGSLLDAAHRAGRRASEPRSANDLAALLYTSGTTGPPKGAAITHANLRLNTTALHQTWRFSSDDHLIHSLPIFHVHGLFVALHCPMLSGAPITFLPRFDPAAVVAALRSATVFMGVPTHYSRLLSTPGFDRATCAGMRLFTSGSAPLAGTLFDEFTARTGHVICERYGMSETLITTSNPYEGDRIAGTVGFALPGIELRTTDEFGHPVPVDQTGVVEVRGSQVMAQYWRRPEADLLCRRDGDWFVTSDLGALDEQGRLTLHGRTSDLIISGGENVYPKEVELLLDAIPGVVESAVVGLPHPDLGEAVTAMIVVDTDSPDDATIADTLQSSLARFKHPKAIVRLAALPLNSMGKVQKKELRELYLTHYSASS